MRTTYGFDQTDTGRWLWVIHAPHEGISGGRIDTAPISFPDKADAVLDLEQHLAAARDGTGRLVRSKDEIKDLIRLAATACEDCHDTYFGGVVWHEADPDGCNWTVSSAQGDDWAGCMDCLHQMAVRLRQTYNIPDEG
jgi:hypothetical protein